MSQHLSLPKSWSTYIGLLCGFCGFPLAYFWSFQFPFFPLASDSVILPVVICATVAGIVGGIIIAPRAAPNSSGNGLLSEPITRAAFISALVASAMVVLSTVLHVSERGSVSNATLTALFIAVICVLPATLLAMCFGSLSRGIVLAFRTERHEPFRLRPIHAAYALALIGFCSPFIAYLLPQAKPLPIQSVAVETPAQIASPSLPPKPTFSYERPANFTSASAAEIEVLARQSLGEVQEPIAFSPDNQRLAYTQSFRAGNHIAVKNLHTWENESALPIQGEIRRLAWSSDGKRLAVVVNYEGRLAVAIVDLATNRVVHLPRPEAWQMRTHLITWPEANELHLHSIAKPQILQLDSLQLRALTESKTTTDAVFPSEVRRTFGFGWSSHATRLQFKSARMGLDPIGTSALSIWDKERSYRRVLSDLSIAEGDRFVFASDASKYVRIRNTGAEVIYFTTRPAPKTAWKLTAPRVIEVQPDAIKSHLAGKTLCAFVYAPLKNPLNNQTVGPDRSKLKAIVRFASWAGPNAEILLAEDYHPISAGDVAADLHAWEKLAPNMLSDFEASEWWVPLGEPTSVTPAKDMPSLAIAQSAKIVQGNGSIIYAGFETVAATPPPPEPPPPAIVQPATAPEERIQQFIRQHHVNTSQGDIGAITTDYAERVEYFTHGTVDRAFIAKDETAYHAKWTVAETIVTPILVEPLDGGKFRARYSTRFQLRAQDGKQMSGLSDNHLLIDVSTGIPLIYRQTAEVSNVVKTP